MTHESKAGLALVELLVVLAIVSALAAVAVPAVQRSREAARRLQCQNNLHQLALGCHAHESMHRSFPYTATNYGTVIGGVPKSYPSVSPHSYLLANIDPAAFSELDLSDGSWAKSGCPPSSGSRANQLLMRSTFGVFLCPSDRQPDGGNNYRANLGPGVGIFRHTAQSMLPGDPWNGTGAFENGRQVPLAEFSDGASNTALFSEKIIGDGDGNSYDALRDRFAVGFDIVTATNARVICRNYAVASPALHDSYSGLTWLFGGWNHTWYNHVAPPNSPTPDCSGGGFPVGGGRGLYCARSFHPGGVNVVFADGGTAFVADGIDLALWTAYSTRAGGEL